MSLDMGAGEDSAPDVPPDTAPDMWQPAPFLPGHKNSCHEDVPVALNPPPAPSQPLERLIVADEPTWLLNPCAQTGGGFAPLTNLGLTDLVYGSPEPGQPPHVIAAVVNGSSNSFDHYEQSLFTLDPLTQRSDCRPVVSPRTGGARQDVLQSPIKVYGDKLLYQIAAPRLLDYNGSFGWMWSGWSTPWITQPNVRDVQPSVSGGGLHPLMNNFLVENGQIISVRDGQIISISLAKQSVTWIVRPSEILALGLPYPLLYLSERDIHLREDGTLELTPRQDPATSEPSKTLLIDRCGVPSFGPPRASDADNLLCYEGRCIASSFPMYEKSKHRLVLTDRAEPFYCTDFAVLNDYSFICINESREARERGTKIEIFNLKENKKYDLLINSINETDWNTYLGTTVSNESIFIVKEYTSKEGKELGFYFISDEGKVLEVREFDMPSGYVSSYWTNSTIITAQGQVYSVGRTHLVSLQTNLTGMRAGRF